MEIPHRRHLRRRPSARLDAPSQKAAKTTAFDLQLNPASPGLHFHRIDALARRELLVPARGLGHPHHRPPDAWQPAARLRGPPRRSLCLGRAPPHRGPPPHRRHPDRRGPRARRGLHPAPAAPRPPPAGTARRLPGPLVAPQPPVVGQPLFAPVVRAAPGRRRAARLDRRRAGRHRGRLLRPCRAPARRGGGGAAGLRRLRPAARSRPGAPASSPPIPSPTPTRSAASASSATRPRWQPPWTLPGTAGSCSSTPPSRAWWTAPSPARRASPARPAPARPWSPCTAPPAWPAPPLPPACCSPPSPSPLPRPWPPPGRARGGHARRRAPHHRLRRPRCRRRAVPARLRPPRRARLRRAGARRGGEGGRGSGRHRLPAALRPVGVAARGRRLADRDIEAYARVPRLGRKSRMSAGQRERLWPVFAAARASLASAAC